jgi:hypothetical protein
MKGRRIDVRLRGRLLTDTIYDRLVLLRPSLGTRIKLEFSKE